MHRLKTRFAEKFDDEIRFIKGMMSRPRTVGAIAPTSSRTARAMADVIDVSSRLPVLELGPGTGVITRAILQHGVEPSRIFSIEYSEDFLSHLRMKYPGVNFLHGDAFDVFNALPAHAGRQFDCVISGIPLLNFPMEARIQLIEDLLDLVPRGRPVVQFSYGPVSPVVAKPESYRIKHHHFIVRNLPPAQIWHYYRPVS
ncbi:phosphatidylethanolamine/phosphatidyl-N-methylethanolamine N-methyltransferase [Rhizobium sp. SG_E_25_P2]|jgi:phosphatidylethanolamine/phosphatidyl-N-methylethanolamine N-methyltransferase|uniref:phospholipid N-methyltransferase PmtA n=1 Tax=Rhizobium sp. SG_E_25_P2 TaxID=2879942 RepID=UPI002475D310|nr:methyltransferase domain-containing protein [Rhizobium sp. SG_E_25_P2]MDH6265280.1 phosphatidylethanolamine/phosphatidyl-N-methylethanolamine N-methyltransferase [Rhizobium sp. SG_E_25_P2]